MQTTLVVLQTTFTAFLACFPTVLLLNPCITTVTLMYALQAFDALLLLQRGGSTLYCGPLGQNAQDLISYFENLGVDKISPNYNAATWMLENTTVLVEEKKNISFSEVFQESDLRR